LSAAADSVLTFSLRMKTLPLAFAAVVQLSLVAQEPTKPAESPQPATPAAEETSAAASELEAKFKETLTNATMSGRWSLIKDGQLTPEKPDKYTIVGVNKIFGERWLIRARIQYGDKDYTAPIPVRVKWAGDTPAITVTDVGLPGGTSYSARVVIYDDSYAGVWSGGPVRGLLSGMITREAK
jgi:hypothetical protein